MLTKKLSAALTTTLTAMLLLGACASKPRIADRAAQVGATSATVNSTAMNSAGSAIPADLQAAAPAIQATEPIKGDLSDTGSDLDALPLEVNKAVLQWIDYFQGRGRPHMERYLQRSTRYMPIMKKILREQGLPEDLIYIALIESGFSSSAKSSAKAVGYWQFIRPTGKHYGLKIDNYVDERRDFVKSTVAAADYFKGLYNLFGAWYLAIASYNVGENRVKNLVIKNRTRDFWKLARENKLPDETQNYVPKFLAARLIAKEPEKYGFTDIEYMPPLEFSEVSFSTSIDLRKLARNMGLEYDDIRDLNPAYKKGVAFINKSKSATPSRLILRVPAGQDGKAIAAADAAAAQDRNAYVADEDYGYYRIRRGDTIASIASKFGTSQRNIRSLNGISSGAKLVAGRRLRVPAEDIANDAPAIVRNQGRKKNSNAAQGLVAKRVLSSNDTLSKKKNLNQAGAAKKARKSKRVHIVRKGETLLTISSKYQVSMRDLMKENRLSRRQKIATGARLEIPE